ncbi:MAG: hypothetical protein JWM61_2239 [Micrococcaceae bacterium]|nr:hypothetical protein [Micrococcaceae bacterium]
MVEAASGRSNSPGLVRLIHTTEANLRWVGRTINRWIRFSAILSRLSSSTSLLLVRRCPASKMRHMGRKYETRIGQIMLVRRVR